MSAEVVRMSGVDVELLLGTCVLVINVDGDDRVAGAFDANADRR
jgi:hypothetical protein